MAVIPIHKEAETRGSGMQGQPGLCSKTQSQKNKKIKKKFPAVDPAQPESEPAFQYDPQGLVCKSKLCSHVLGQMPLPQEGKSSSGKEENTSSPSLNVARAGSNPGLVDAGLASSLPPPLGSSILYPLNKNKLS